MNCVQSKKMRNVLLTSNWDHLKTKFMAWCERSRVLGMLGDTRPPKVWWEGVNKGWMAWPAVKRQLGFRKSVHQSICLHIFMNIKNMDTNSQISHLVILCYMSTNLSNKNNSNWTKLTPDWAASGQWCFTSPPDVTTIVAIFTIVAINHNCHNTLHNCLKKLQLSQS